MTAGQVGMPIGPGGVPLEVPMEEVKGFAGFWQRQHWTVFTIVEVAVVLSTWDVLVARMQVINPFFFPAPSMIGSELWTMATNGYLWEHFGYSVRNLALGYGGGAVVGITIGLIVGASGILNRLWGPVIWSLYSTPIITIRPLLIIWFGLGWTALALLVFISTVFPVLINTMSGVHTVEVPLLRAARVFGASRLDLYTKVILPYTVPFILTGLRLAIGSALIGMLVGEMVSSNFGLGYIVTVGSYELNMSKSFAAVAVLIAMSLTLVNSVRWLEDRIAPWRKEG